MNKSEFLNTLFQFRDLINQKDNQNGVNRWILITSLISLFWLSADKLVRVDFSSPSVILFCIGFLIYEVFITDLKGLFKKNRINKVHYVESSFNKVVLLYLFYLLAATTLVFIVLLFNTNGFYGTLLLIFYLGRIVFVALSALILIFIKEPLGPANILRFPDTENIKIGARIVSVIACILGIVVVYNIKFELNQVTVDTFKHACIFIAMHLIIEKLIINIKYSSFLGALDKIIYNTTFDKVDLEKANEDFRILMLGKDLDDVAKPYLKKYLDIHNQLEEFKNNLKSDLKRLPELKIKELKEFASSLDSKKEHLDDLQRKLSYNMNMLVKILKRHKRVDSDLKTIEEFLSNIEESQNKSSKSVKKFKKAADKAMKKINVPLSVPPIKQKPLIISRLSGVLVPRAGVEPARPKTLVFETNASTDSATWAFLPVSLLSAKPIPLGILNRVANMINDSLLSNIRLQYIF
jgi:hypothetical protein